MLQLSDPAWDGLQDLARRLGYTQYTGGNVTGLLEAIGHDLWLLTRNTDPAGPGRNPASEL